MEAVNCTSCDEHDLKPPFRPIDLPSSGGTVPDIFIRTLRTVGL